MGAVLDIHAQATMSRIEPGDGDPRHGTENGYCNLDCRCVRCKVAWAEAYDWRRNQERALTPDDLRHGTENGYRYWHCKCRACLDAHAAAHASRKAKQQDMVDWDCAARQRPQ